MLNIKYPLRTANLPFSTGETNLKMSRGSLIDTNGCIVLLITSGRAAATINFKRYVLQRGDFVLLFYDSTLLMNSISETFSTRFCSFAYELVEEAIYKPLSVDFWNILYDKPVFHTTKEQKERLEEWLKQMEWINGIEGKQQKELLMNNIRNLLVATDVEIVHHGGNPLHNQSNHTWILLVNFFKLVALHCRDTRDVQFYADQLSITTTYLYKLCRKFIQLSPKEVIDRQTVTEIKTYLLNTDMPVKVIAAELGFDDASYMCRYFKRQTGKSPLYYRDERGYIDSQCE